MQTIIQGLATQRMASSFEEKQIGKFSYCHYAYFQVARHNRRVYDHMASTRYMFTSLEEDYQIE